jgi:hypothetical protein
MSIEHGPKIIHGKATCTKSIVLLTEVREGGEGRGRRREMDRLEEGGRGIRNGRRKEGGRRGREGTEEGWMEEGGMEGEREGGDGGTEEIPSTSRVSNKSFAGQELPGQKI